MQAYTKPGISTSLYSPRNLRPDGEYAEDLIYLCHTIIIGRVYDPRYDKGKNGGFVPLKGEYMQNILGHRQWPVVRRIALGRGVVLCDESYSVGRCSKGYALCEPYASAPWELREIHDPRLSQRIDEWRAQRRLEHWSEIRDGNRRVSPEVCEHLHGHLQRIRIDKHIPDALTNESAVAVDMIRRGQWRFDVDDFGRVHTNITNLKRSLRAHLSVDDMRLVNCDIANSQPLFIGIMLQQTGGKGQVGDKRQGEGGETGSKRSKEEGPTICWARCGKIGKMGADLLRYVQLCAEGRLYRHIEARLDGHMDYAVLKHRVLATLYDRDSHRNAIYRVLDKDFPTVMQGIRAIKRPNYRHLAHLAQRTESGFIFGRVVSRLAEEHPGLFVTTIHDSIMTTAGDEDTVRSIMLDEFEKLNIRATVRVES